MKVEEELKKNIDELKVNLEHYRKENERLTKENEDLRNKLSLLCEFIRECDDPSDTLEFIIEHAEELEGLAEEIEDLFNKKKKEN